MILEYAENIFQLLMILTALLIALFRYIGSKRRCWFFAVLFFLGNLLSCYFWTAYLVIMGDLPNASDLLTYFGWNVAFITLLFQTYQMTEPDDRKRFPIVMFLPIPLGVVQFFMYIQYGGIINNLYQVGVCTVTACLCIRGILLNLKRRREGATPLPAFVAILIAVCSEFAMWTSSCFDGFVGSLYYPFSFVCSANYLFYVWAISKSYEQSEEDEVLIDKKIQNILKGAFVAVVLVCSVGGVLFGAWIRDILMRGIRKDGLESVYDIIPAILFLISMIIPAFAASIISVVYFEQKVAENNKLREARTIAERANEAKSDFLASMSHEIRTPINAILGMNEMILHKSIKGKKSIPEGAEVLGQISGFSANIESAGNSLLMIINDILDFSKIEAGRMEITEGRYKLSSVIRDVSNMVTLRAKAKGLEYRAVVDEDLPEELYGDEVRIRQIITNLLTNAVKYTDEGRVTMTVKGSCEGGYREGENMELSVSVRDTGIGIREEDLGKLFSKFQRVDLARNSSVEGTGLGLAITEYLIGRMGGTIDVKSVYGEGSVFSAVIPQKIVSAAPIGDFRRLGENDIRDVGFEDKKFRAPDARILVVDDTAVNLTVVVGLLEDTKIVTDTANSGEKALEMTLAAEYDLILLDQRMPHMDGTETLRRIREQEGGKNKNTDVICLTADAVSGAKEKYIAEGFNDYLTKPIDSSALRGMLMEYLPEEKIITEDLSEGEEAGEDLSTEYEGKYAPLIRAGIDPQKGRAFCNENEELYGMVLQEYVSTFDDISSRMVEFLGSGDLKNYCVIVHALKNTSRTIGADHLADLAYELEKASDDQDRTTVDEKHPAMFEEYKKSVDAIKELQGTEPEEI